MLSSSTPRLVAPSAEDAPRRNCPLESPAAPVGRSYDPQPPPAGFAADGLSTRASQSVIPSRCWDFLELPDTEIPPIFDGTRPWSEFQRLLDDMAEEYHWSERKRCRKLYTSLRGRAQRFHGTLPESTLRSYEAIKTAMREHFTVGTHTGYHIFHNRMQGPKETLDDFALELERLGRAVFGELPELTYNNIMVQRFIDGIRETAYQVPIISSNPRSLMEALDMAIRIEAQCRRRPGGTVMNVTAMTAETQPSAPRSGGRGPRRNGRASPESPPPPTNQAGN
nr:uncharacterized protein LOC123002540 [Drosophila takahashii]